MPGLTLQNRPTQAGLYFFNFPLPQRMPYSEVKSKLEGKVSLPQTAQMKAGMFVYEDPNTGKRTAWTEDAVKSFIESGDKEIPGATWTNEFAILGANGLVHSIGCYVFLLEDIPVPPGLVDVQRTEFDANGKIVAEWDSQGNKFEPPKTDPIAPSEALTMGSSWTWLGAGASLLAFAGIFFFAPFIFKVLLILGIVAALVAVFSEISAPGKGGIAALWGKLKKGIKQGLGNIGDTVNSALKWGVGILATVFAVQAYTTYRQGARR